MPTQGKKNTQRNQGSSRKARGPRSAEIAGQGIRTGSDFANCMSALMADLAEGLIDPRTGNAMCNAGGKMLKVIEMQYRYGTPQEGKVGRICEPGGFSIFA